MAIAGQIEYTVTVDTSGLKKGLNEAEKETKSWASSVSSIAKTGAKLLGGAMIAGATATTTAITKMTSESIKSFADYEQLQGGVNKIFKENAKDVMDYAQKAYKTAGISANTYMEQATSFSAKLIKETGGNTKRVAELTDMAIKDMADNANTFGTSLESIQSAYAGLAKGNATMLDNLKLGYGGTSTEMLKLAKDMGVIDESVKSFNDMSFEDAIEAIHKLQGQLEITGTTANEAESTISGSLGMTKSAWANLVAGMADDEADMDTLISNLMDSLGSLAKNLVPKISVAVKGAIKTLTAIIPELMSAIPSLIQDLLPAVLEGTQILLTSFVESLPELVQILLDSLPIFLDAIMSIINSIIDNLPMFIEALTQLILGIIKILTSPDNMRKMLNAGLTLLMSLVNAIPDFLIALIDALPDIITNIILFLIDPKTIGMIVEAGVKLFMGLVQAIPKILSALFSAFGKLFGDLWNGLQNMFKEFAANFGEGISKIFKGAVNGVLAFIEGFINAPIDIINFFIDAINGLLGLVSGGSVQIGKLGRVSLPRMATGGIVPKGGQLIYAGEGGQDEWIVPESKMASMVEKLNERSGMSGITINIQGVFATSDAEQRAVAEQIYDKLQEINKSRMGAYL